MRGLMTEEGFSFNGEHFTLKDAYCNPKSVQKPYPPIWIAGDSPPTQKLMVEHGDVWFMYSKSPEKVAKLVEGMREQRHDKPFEEIGRAHVGTQVTNAHLVCTLTLDKNNNDTLNYH